MRTAPSARAPASYGDRSGKRLTNLFWQQTDEEAVQGPASSVKLCQSQHRNCKRNAGDVGGPRIVLGTRMPSVSVRGAICVTTVKTSVNDNTTPHDQKQVRTCSDCPCVCSNSSLITDFALIAPPVTDELIEDASTGDVRSTFR